MSYLIKPSIRCAGFLVSVLLGACGASTPYEDADMDETSDGDLDAPADGDPRPECPTDMVLVPSQLVCVDRFEASAGPAGEATSVGGAMPWDLVSWDEASAACEAAGKRLCQEGEWLAACRGPEGHSYPYGDYYGTHLCNGFEHGAGVAVETGSMAGCEGGFPALFDMSGNVWEWIADCSDDLCHVRGGSFNRHETGMRCTADLGFAPDERYAAIGFRCCFSL